MAAPLIGIADHDPVLMRLLTHVLREAGFESIHLPQGSSAYDQIKDSQPDLIILDTWLENREAGWVLFQILRLDPETKHTPILFCSSDREEFERRAASLDENDLIGTLHKPFDIDVLVARIRQMLASAEIHSTIGRNGVRAEVAAQ